MIYNSLLKGNMVTEEVDSRLLQDNPLGDTHCRRVPVYLPPGYHNGDQRYPTLYLLTGLFGTGSAWLNFRAFEENVIQIVDRLISDGSIPPCMLVFPDCFTRYGGSQYINSSGTGAYMSHIVEELVPQIDAHYRTLAENRFRAVVGKSSGGFGALRLGMSHAELFAHVASSAGDLHFAVTCLPEIARFPFAIERLGGLDAFLQSIGELRQLKADHANALNVVALSACYSPAPEEECGFELPVHLHSGELNDEVFARWLMQDPVVRITRFDRELDALAGLDTLYVEAGTRDEYHADLGARVFCSRLRARGVSVIQQEFDGGHFGTTWRYEHILPFLLNRMPLQEL